MLNLRNITANLITTTIVASGIAYFSLGITWAQDAGNSENHSRTTSVGISSPSDRTSVPPRTRASSKDTVTPVFLNTPSPYPDAWVTTHIPHPNCHDREITERKKPNKHKNRHLNPKKT